MGPPMPREGELSMQYYAKVLNPAPKTSKCPFTRALTTTAHLLGKQRLIYAESIYEEDKAIDLITTHICDEEVGKDLLNDQNAMRADLLKNAAKKYLDQLKTDHDPQKTSYQNLWISAQENLRYLYNRCLKRLFR